MEIRNIYCKAWMIFLIVSSLLLTKCDNKKDVDHVKIAFAAEEFPRVDSRKYEGKLRATAMVIEKEQTKLCIVSCDILKIPREIADEVERKIEAELGIPFSNIMITATHTHSGPNVYDPSFDFRVLENSIFSAVSKANEKLKSSAPVKMYFCLGQEATVGQNSRMLLSDSTIYWYGNYPDAIRPTGTFDPDLPVIAFKSKDEKIEGVLFNHSTHNIGARTSGSQSPAFYGLAAQELEEELGGKFLFLLGAHGSLHDMMTTPDERVFRIRQAVKDALDKASKMEITRVASVKEEFEFRVREFDEEKEEEAVSFYCRKRLGNLDDKFRWPPGPGEGKGPDPEVTISDFRNSRHSMAKHQGELRKTWLQVMEIGDVAFVGIGGELFNELGIEIKRRSPFRYTYIVDLSNDYIGYIPDKKGFELGGYQLWMGRASYLTKGTGEVMVDKAVQLLTELYEER